MLILLIMWPILFSDTIEEIASKFVQGALIILVFGVLHLFRGM